MGTAKNGLKPPKMGENRQKWTSLKNFVGIFFIRSFRLTNETNETEERRNKSPVVLCLVMIETCRTEPNVTLYISLLKTESPPPEISDND